MYGDMAGKRGTPKSIVDANIRLIFFRRSRLKSSSRIIWWTPQSTRFCKARRQAKSAMEKFLFPKWIKPFGYGIRSAESPRCSPGYCPPNRQWEFEVESVFGFRGIFRAGCGLYLEPAE